MSEDTSDARRELEVGLASQQLRSFQPQETRRTLAKLDKLIELAAELREWSTLDQAIGLKFEEICDLVVYWHRLISGNWGGDRSKYADHDTCSFRDLEQRTGIKQPQISRWNAAIGITWDGPLFVIDGEKRDAYFEKVRVAACRKAGLEPEHNRVAPNSGENEWFTPVQYIEAAREVMGGIDLDPATHPLAQKTIEATQYYTKEDDGLSLSWRGRVWLNPPYAQPWIGQFVEKLTTEVGSGSVEQAIMLTNNCTDTGWFHQAEAGAALLGFTKGRIRFINVEGEPGEAPLQGQCFFYFGSGREAFAQVFSRFGFVR